MKFSNLILRRAAPWKTQWSLYNYDDTEYWFVMKYCNITYYERVVMIHRIMYTYIVDIITTKGFKIFNSQ